MDCFFGKEEVRNQKAILTEFKKNFCSQIFFVILEMLNPLLVKLAEMAILAF